MSFSIAFPNDMLIAGRSTMGGALDASQVQVSSLAASTNDSLAEMHLAYRQRQTARASKGGV